MEGARSSVDAGAPILDGFKQTAKLSGWVFEEAEDFEDSMPNSKIDPYG